uniref:Uncharacterized protein LOC105032716 isoform X2 n=1 Tax=Elaeis guineensis var. tenera TaxID=51953 RepID=A0A8N4EQC0_ELAGV|nr:uncharacterized protein LOC105032716 isoform X2 [Elaeis guineensis]
MEGNLEENREVEGEEEYLLLDLDEICVHGDIPANAPYVLSGLDTLNPILVIGDRLKLIGEYQETIGTCFVFSESGNYCTYGHHCCMISTVSHSCLHIYVRVMMQCCIRREDLPRQIS